MQRRHHYERAFEEYLRARRIPYVAVDEARKTLLPRGPAGDGPAAMKSFDLVVYGQNTNLLVDIKGRRIVSRSMNPRAGAPAAGTLQSWVTQEDLESLAGWEDLFGPGFEAVFVFIYWCSAQPPDALFQEVFEHRGEWYALRSVRRSEYVREMRPRSAKWRTVHVPAAAFERVSQPFAPAGLGRYSGQPSQPWAEIDQGPVEAALQPRA